MSAILDRLGAALADRYRLEREVGAGGMATVYLAEDVKDRRKVAVKVLRPELAATLANASPSADREPADTLLAELSTESTRLLLYPTKGDRRAIIAGGLYYIRTGEGREELFDLREDSLETRDLAGLPEYRSSLLALRAALAGRTAAAGSAPDPRPGSTR